MRCSACAAVVLGLLGAWHGAEASPRADFLLHCGGCHLADGSGSPPDVPSLRGELAWIARLPEGRDYLARVPGASQSPLSDGELAAVINWILVEFNGAALGEDFVPFAASEVSKARRRVLLDPLKYRAELWRANYAGDPAVRDRE